jgi:hypothetical protein
MTFRNIEHCSEATYILWPERRWVSEGTLRGWYLDAVDNGEIADEYLHAHDLQTMRRALSDAGHITLGQSS